MTDVDARLPSTIIGLDADSKFGGAARKGIRMRAVIANVPADFLQQRRRRGADIWDEMWEGVLHMPPAPNIEHQDFEYQLEARLRTHWARAQGRRVYHGVNLAPAGGWPDDYRIPDLVLLTADCAAKNRGEWLEGPPTVVIEIRSPGDETFEKMTSSPAPGCFH
jgi:putative restriction endonuclease